MTLFGYQATVVAVAAVTAVVVAAAGAIATDLGQWYDALKQPRWKPPDWLFGPAWTIIFALTAYAAIDAYTAAMDQRARNVVVAVFVINAVLNILWSWIFFRLQRPDWALFEVVLLWLSIVTIMVAVSPHSTKAVWLLIPYLIWVGFAGALNYAIVRMNGPFT